MKQTTKIIFLSLLTLTIYSCQKSDNNDLQEAQLCLNTATAASAQSCVTKIASNTSENAYKLRCSATFIANNFGSPTSFVTALDQIKNGSNAPGCVGGACSGTLVAMSSLNFGTTAAANDAAVQAFADCSASGVGIYTQISSIFKIGTLLAVAGSGTSPAALAAALAGLAVSNPAAVGEIVQTTYASSCQNLDKASDSTKQYCAQLSVALANGQSNADIGSCLLNKMNNPAYTFPPTCP